MIKWQVVLFLGQIMGNASGDWLDGGWLDRGPDYNYGEVRSWFTNLIFRGSAPARVQPIALWKLRAELPYRSQPAKMQPFLSPSTHFQPEFRNRLIPQWTDFGVSWSATTGFAESRRVPRCLREWRRTGV